MRLVQFQLGRVLDGHHALALGNEGREHIEQGGFTGAGAARDQNVEFDLHTGRQERGHALGQRAKPDQILNGVRIHGKLANGQDRSIQ